MAKNKKKNKLLLILPLIIIIIIVGLFYYKDNILKKGNTIKEKEEITMLKDNDIKNSIFKKEYKKATEIVSNMSLKEKVGQLFLVRYNKNDIEYLSNFYPGGYILFAKDFDNHTKDEMIEELKKDQYLNKYGLVLGVDEEGGYVTRISRFETYRNERFKSPRSYYEEGGYPLLEQAEIEKINLLKELGINLNLAPVADISTDENDFIYLRAFGKGKEETSNFVSKMVEIANKNGMSSCLKHFPGYGNNKDTHTGSAIDERSYENFLENDFVPFKSGIEKNVPFILVSHNIVKSMDEELPASLSSKVIHELRSTLKYTGIITTDDFEMDAVKQYVEEKKAATLAINAGVDMVMTSDFLPMYNEILTAVENNIIKEETINKAVLRVIAWKLTNNIIK